MDAALAATTAEGQAYLGMTEAAASARASAQGHPVRVVERDFASLEVHQDLRYDRVDLHVVGGVVVRVTAG